MIVDNPGAFLNILKYKLMYYHIKLILKLTVLTLIYLNNSEFIKNMLRTPPV